MKIFRNQEYVDEVDRTMRLLEVRAKIREGKYPSAEAVREATRLALRRIDGAQVKVVRP